MSTIVWISKGLFAINVTSSAQVGAQQFGLLDGKSAFDVVVHANMIRRLFQIGFSKQSITLINKFPILPPSPELLNMSSSGFTYTL
jgi:hypothetical protein